MNWIGVDVPRTTVEWAVTVLIGFALVFFFLPYTASGPDYPMPAPGVIFLLGFPLLIIVAKAYRDRRSVKRSQLVATFSLYTIYAVIIVVGNVQRDYNTRRIRWIHDARADLDQIVNALAIHQARTGNAMFPADLTMLLDDQSLRVDHVLTFKSDLDEREIRTLVEAEDTEASLSRQSTGDCQTVGARWRRLGDYVVDCSTDRSIRDHWDVVVAISVPCPFDPYLRSVAYASGFVSLVNDVGQDWVSEQNELRAGLGLGPLPADLP